MITLGYSALGISLPVFVADAQGLFAKHGVDVSLKQWPNAHPLCEAIADGEVSMGGFIAFPISFHRHAMARPLRYACAIVEDDNHPISFLVVRKGSGIRSIEDLAGREVGVLPTKAYREWLKLLGKKHGVGYYQVTLDQTCKCMTTGEACAATGLPLMRVHDLQVADTTAALRDGRVDAVFTNDPAVTASIRAGVAEVLHPGVAIVPKMLGTPYYFGSFVFEPSFVARQPDLARRVVCALDDAIDAMSKEPELAPHIAQRYLPPQACDIRDGLGNPRFLRSDEVDAKRLQVMAQTLTDVQVIRGEVDILSSMITGQPGDSAQTLAAQAV